MYYFSFWNTLFSKVVSNFWQTVIHWIWKTQQFSKSMMIFVLKSCLFQNQTAWSTESKYSLWLIDLLTSYLMSKMSVSELLKNTKPWKTLLKTLLKGDSQNLRLIDGHFPTLCSHCFANYMNIFHKTEVQTVILRCWMVLYLNWFKSYLWLKTQIFISLSVSFNFGKKTCYLFNVFSVFYIFCFLYFCHNFWNN